ncbi:MAG: DUF3443 domain-containing protein, partial [Pseudomonadota bacterium]|nr:DUF3443 domain-containing protein [Pseudomonadota bacterium]
MRASVLALCALALTGCGGGGGSTPSAASPAPAVSTVVVSIGTSPSTIVAGMSTDVSWTATGAASCHASGSWSGDFAAQGKQTVTPLVAGDYSYALTCDGVSTSAKLHVDPAPPAPVVNLSLSSSSVGTGAVVTLSWTSTNATGCTASDSWSGARATTGQVQVSTTTAGTFPYSLSCTGLGGTKSASTSLSVTTGTQNTIPIVMDAGPVPSSSNSLNVPYVSVKLCAPGTTICQIIDHVLLDTGSNGLRLAAGVLSAGVSLPPVKDSIGRPAATCAQFASGTMWGSLRRADVILNGETASAIPVEIASDPDPLYSPVPAACSAKGQSLSTVAQLGANGILGVGLFTADCGIGCELSPTNGVYYGCVSGSGCIGTGLAQANQINNPVARFAVDNNGVILRMPAVASGGATSLSGTLIFGIGTQANNQFASESVFGTTTGGEFTTVYKGTTATTSFIDSGSNLLVFTDNALPQCTTPAGYYCPAATTPFSLQTLSADGSVSATVNLSID